jgi:hypothetical protein
MTDSEGNRLHTGEAIEGAFFVEPAWWQRLAQSVRERWFGRHEDDDLESN